MSRRIHELRFDGALLARGFWLYVCEVTAPNGEMLYYVGRTGDSSSENAQSPFNRIGQHLGFNIHSNRLRAHLVDRGVDPDECTFRFVAHGPIAGEAEGADEHRRRRDDVAAFERELARAMGEAGHVVINTVASRKPLDADRFRAIRAAFAVYFPKLAGESPRLHG